MIISPRVTSPHATDFSSLAALLESPRLAGKRGEALALAIWELFVDREEGLYHFWPPLERLTGHFVWDPLKIFNCFGWSICGLTANLLAVVCKAAGLPDARIVNLAGHEATEVSWDGAWHLLDANLQAFHRRHPPHEAQIASYEQCLADPTLVSRQANPSRPYYLPDRPPAEMAKLYSVPPSWDRAFPEFAHTMDFVLRPGERLERHTFNEGLWIWFANYAEMCKLWPGELKDDGPWERNEPHRRFGNGRWVYEPRLTSEFCDFFAGVLEADGVDATPRGALAWRSGPTACTFEFDSPWVFTGTPVRDGHEVPRDGAIVEATVLQGAGASARIRLAVDPDLPWLTVWEGPGEGRHEVRLDLTPHVVNAYRYLLRFEFDAPAADTCGIEKLRVESAIMVRPASLGHLVEGPNDLTVRFGDESGPPLRRWIVETNLRDEADVRRKTYRLENVRFVADAADRILPADPGRDYEIVFKVAPPPCGLLGRIYAFGAFRGKAPDDPAEGRVAAYLAESEAGPWRPLFESPVLVDPHRWHFAAQGELELGQHGARAAYVKFVGKVGLINAKVRAHYFDRRLTSVRTPLLVTHVWDDAGGRKTHTERVAPPCIKPHPYTLACGPHPALRSIIMEAESVPM